MTEANDSLVERLSSADASAADQALGQLIRQGPAATPALLKALSGSNPQARELAASGLSEVGDASSADPLFAALDDQNEKVRARAAVGLARLKDPRSLDALFRTFNDAPDVLHNPYTLAVYTLMNAGTEVLPRVAPLLKSPDPMTRARAFAVLKAVAPKAAGGEAWEKLWTELGSYDPNGPEGPRNAAADRWAEWIESRAPAGGRA